MKILDRTPLIGAKGDVGILARVVGTLKYGLNWSAEVDAQAAVIAQLDRALEKGFVLIRNFTLPSSSIVIPLALIGRGGVQVIYVTPAKGRFEAKGDQWNTVNGSGNSQPARINLINHTARLARAFQKFLEMQKVTLHSPVEPVLISINPGAHIESMRPSIKVIKSDTVKPYINSLLQATPVWSPEFIYKLADRLVDPRLADLSSQEAPASEKRQSTPRPEPEREVFEQESSDFEDAPLEEKNAPPPSILRPSDATHSQPRLKKTAPKKILGLTSTQAILLAGLLVGWCCVTAVIAFLYLSQPV